MLYGKFLYVPSKQGFISIVLKQIFKSKNFKVFKNWKPTLKPKDFVFMNELKPIYYF